MPRSRAVVLYMHNHKHSIVIELSLLKKEIREKERSTKQKFLCLVFSNLTKVSRTYTMHKFSIGMDKGCSLLCFHWATYIPYGLESILNLLYAYNWKVLLQFLIHRNYQNVAITLFVCLALYYSTCRMLDNCNAIKHGCCAWAWYCCNRTCISITGVYVLPQSRTLSGLGTRQHCCPLWNRLPSSRTGYPVWEWTKHNSVRV